MNYFERIQQLLFECSGLEISRLGPHALENAIRRRMARDNQENPSSYVAMLERSSAELHSLLEELVVSETWFFREKQSFHALEWFVRETWLPAHPTKVNLRVLSLPCATGEEPYSIAMCLIDQGLAPERIHIDAVDISASVVEKATKGVYGKNAFRGVNVSGVSHNFEVTMEGMAVRPEVKETVRFLVGNLFDQHFVSNLAPYDVIFCRNLFIYFNQEMQVRAVDALDRLLMNEGLLVLGHADRGVTLQQRFAAFFKVGAFSYRKTKLPHSDVLNSTQVQRRTIKKLPPSKAKTIAPPRPVPPPILSEIKLPGSPVEEIRSLADGGKRREAIVKCETYLHVNPADAEAWFLLGLLRARAAPADAEVCFNKALYLNPDHYEAIIHLALIVDGRGDGKAAATLRARAKRIANRQSATNQTTNHNG